MKIKLLNELLQELRFNDFLFEFREATKEFNYGTLANKANITRESIYKATAPTHRPEFHTIAKLINAMGLTLAIVEQTQITNLTDYKRDSLAGYPHLKAEYHPTKNKDNQLDDHALNSRRQIWWLCVPHNHEWKESAQRRIKGASCPYCAAAKLLKSLDRENNG